MNDETAFKLEHADWDSDRANLPKICWRYNEDEDHNPRPNKNPLYMRFKGLIVLDPNDDPVKDWPELPATLSSKTRGYRLEMMSRQNPHLEYKDFIARMPALIEKTKKDKDTGEMGVVMEAPDPNVVCNMRMFRFRKEKGLLSWTEKGNTKVIGEGLEKLFGDRLVDNSMESFGRDLTPWEQSEIRRGKEAYFPTSKAADGTKKRKSKAAKTTTSTQQGDAKVQKALQQRRPREDSESLDSSEDQRATAASHRKRHRNARGEASTPVIDVDDEQDLSATGPATGAAPEIIEVESNPTPQAPNLVSDDSHGGDGLDSLFEDDGLDSLFEDDGLDSLFEDGGDEDQELKGRTSPRPIHPLPARRAQGGVSKALFLDPAQTHEQNHGIDANVESQPNATHGDDVNEEETSDWDDFPDIPAAHGHDANIESQPNATGGDDVDQKETSDWDDFPDIPSSGETNVPVEDEAEEENEADEEDEEEREDGGQDITPIPPIPPLARQETDLERHRRITREYLAEADDFHWEPAPNDGWRDPLFFSSYPN